MLLLRAVIPELQLKNKPEKSAQVEVVGKKISKYSSSGSKMSGYRTSYTYIVAFEFSDGSVKELSVDRKSYRRTPKSEPYSSAYDSIQEGDIGTLIYKEIDNIEGKYKNEEMYWEGRLFISVEKAPEYGGTKIGISEPSEMVGALIMTALFAFVSVENDDEISANNSNCFLHFSRGRSFNLFSNSDDKRYATFKQPRTAGASGGCWQKSRKLSCFRWWSRRYYLLYYFQTFWRLTKRIFIRYEERDLPRHS